MLFFGPYLNTQIQFIQGQIDSDSAQAFQVKGQINRPDFIAFLLFFLFKLFTDFQLQNFCLVILPKGDLKIIKSLITAFSALQLGTNNTGQGTFQFIQNMGLDNQRVI